MLAARPFGKPGNGSTVGQDENRFFKYVWRFNALVVAGASIIVVLLGLYAAVQVFMPDTRSRRVTNVVDVGDKDTPSDEFALGRATVIEGTPYVKIPLYRGRPYSPSSLSLTGGTQRAVNYLFVNTSSGESKWLFEVAGQLITESEVLYDKARNSPGESRRGIGVVYTLVERDSNGDNRLTDKDALSLAFTKIDGSTYRKLIENAKRFDYVGQVADDKVLVLYQRNQDSVVELYGLPSMTRLQQSRIAKIKLN
ncbi:MAG: hypothetical protein ABW175_25400 [Bradyrhizobium sp.]